MATEEQKAILEANYCKKDPEAVSYINVYLVTHSWFK